MCVDYEIVMQGNARGKKQYDSPMQSKHEKCHGLQIKCHGLQMVDNGIEIAKKQNLKGSIAIGAILGHLRNREPDITDTLLRLLEILD